MTVGLLDSYAGVSFWPTGKTGRAGRVMWCIVGGDLIISTKRLGTITIPDGFIFDGPSIPWLIVPWFPQGQMFIPAALHDYLTQKTKFSKYSCDAAFFDALKERGIHDIICRICYTAVRTKRARN